MFGSTPIIRRLAGLAIVAGAFAALVPVAQADSGFQGEHDAVDPVAALQRAQQSATFDGREASRLELSAPAPRVRYQGEHDIVDPVLTLQRAQQSATFDGREASRLELSAPAPQVRYQGEHDIVDPVLALQRVQKSAMFDGREYARLDLTPTRPDVIEQEFAAGQLQYTYQPTSSSGFDWNDFGIGAGAGIGLMLLLLGIGAGAWTTRRGQRQVSSI